MWTELVLKFLFFGSLILLVYLFVGSPVKKLISGFLFLFRRAAEKNKSRADKSKIQIDLGDLSQIWTRQKKVQIQIEDLSKIWRTHSEEIEEDDELTNYHFKHDELLEFYVLYLRGKKWFKGKIKKVIFEVMKILDEKGDVPSVIKNRNEAYDLDENTYTLLSRVPLYIHSINVAVEGLNLGVSGIIEPQLVLACLSHDLGKIPGYFARLYTLGDHPVISAAVLDQIHGFKELPFAEEVRQAVINHHRTGKGKLVELLKKADRNARRKELAEMMQKSEQDQHQQEKDKVKAKELRIRSEKVEEEVKKEKASTEKSKEKTKVSAVDFYSDQDEEAEKVVYEYDLSWLKVGEFMQELKKEVNRVVGGKWIAFSMPDGVVYVHPTGLWNIFKKLALKERIPEVITCEGDKTLKRSILVSLIEVLRREGCIEEGLIQEGYFSAPFLVYREDEKEPVRVLYTPLKAEAFGVIPSEFEKLKKGTVLEKIVKVEPAYS